MKKPLKYFLAIIILGSSMLINAQTEPLNIYRLVVTKTTDVEQGLQVDENGQLITPPPPTEYSYNVIFKISDPANVSEIQILLGSAQNSGDYTDQVFQLNQQNEEYYLSNNEQSNLIVNNAAVAKFIVPTEQRENIKWCTVKAKDTDGNFTESEHFKL